MSIKLQELLKLPSLRDAKVIAGKAGLSKLVSSISVLEHTDVDSLKYELFNNDEFYGSEIVISSLIHIKDDIEAQCGTIRHLHKVGEVALILYYVGIFIPKVAQKVINLADELGFTLIVMPENTSTLRYSEVIYEVVEAIVKQEMTETNFASKLLEQISTVPVSKRNVDTMLKILTDRTRASAVLTDNAGQVINSVTWPRISTLNLEQITSKIDSKKIQECNGVWFTKRAVMQNGLPTMQLHLIKEKEPLTEELVVQMCEVVQVFMNLWGRNYEEISTAELMKAIMNDESVKMRRLAKILRIDVSTIQNMWLIEVKNLNLNEQVLAALRQYITVRFQASLIDFYDDFIVVLMDKGFKQENFEELANLFYQEMDRRGFHITIVQCLGMENTTDVQGAYTPVLNYLDATKKIYADKKVFSLQETKFAANCFEIVNSGELAIAENLKPIQPLLKLGVPGVELMTTLAVFLLDAENNYTLAAEKLFLHKNTIKYRVAKINELLQYPVTKLPEIYNFYRAAAIWRLLGELDKNK